MKTQLRFVICMLLAASTLSATWAQQPVATVQLDSVWGCPGQVVEVPLRVSGVSELGIRTFHFTISLNSDILEPIVLSHDPATNLTFPSFTGFNDELMQRGGFVANFVNSEILITWIDRTAGLNPPVLEDGSVMFNLNLRIRDQLVQPEPIEVRIATMTHLNMAQSVSYEVQRRRGYVLAKSAPVVRIDRTFMDNPSYSQLEWPAADPRRISDVTICEDHPFQFRATGAERFVWENVPTDQVALPVEGIHWVLDRVDVYNPVFTPRSGDWYRENTPWNPWQGLRAARSITLVARGYDSDGCFGTDTVRITVTELAHPFAKLPNAHMIIESGATVDLEFELEPFTLLGDPTHELRRRRQVVRWFPYDKFDEAKTVEADSIISKTSRPIYESTWIWAEIRQLPLHIADTSLARAIHSMNGCVQVLNVRVDIEGEMFNARISAMNPDNLQEYDYFCGTPGVTEQRTMLAALVEGGSGRRSYAWEYRPLHGGQEPIIVDITANPTEIIFFGSTEVFVTIFDSVSGQEIFLEHTLTVETARTLSVNIAMDDASQRFYEMGFCEVPHMPLTLLATVDNQGAHYQVFWEETRANGNTYRVHAMEGREARFPQARAGSVYRAVVQSQDRCVTQHNVWSNDIDPRSQWFESSAVILDQAHSPGCNTTPTELVFRVFNSGAHPLIHIYRNDELFDSFDSIVANPSPFHMGFRRQVESKNYWDRFSVRFTNQTARCLRTPSVMSEEITLNAQTTRYLNAGNIVSIFGGDEVCDTPDGVFTFRLENMEQFGRGATVVWRVNGVEWGRYEFNPDLSDSAGSTIQRPSQTLVLNDLLDIDEATAFAQGFPFHINAEGFPQIGKDFFSGNSLSVTVVSRVMCGASAGNIASHETSLTPRFIDKQDAVLALVQDQMSVCRGDRIEFTAELQHFNTDVGRMSWFLNGHRVGEGTTFALNHALNNDEVSVLFESNFACAPNLPLRETRTVVAYDIPTLALIADTLVCVGEDVQLYAETNAETFLWTGNNFISPKTIQNPIAELPGLNTAHDFTVTVTNAGGCQATASITVRTAPKDEISANIWLENPADTIVCRGNLVVVNSAFSSIGNANVERVWLRNGLKTQHTAQQLATSAIRDGDVWQMQIAMPTLNTCMPRTVVSNPVEFQTAGITIKLDPTRHPNACANPAGQYLFVAVPRCPATTTLFNWYINGLNAGFRLGDHPTFDRELNPGDIVHARITSCQGNIVFSNSIEILASPITPTFEGSRVICSSEETTALSVENPQEHVTFRWYSSDDNFTQMIGEGTTLSNMSIGHYRIVATNANNCETVVDVDIVEGLQPQARITLLTSPLEIRTREPIRFRNDATGWERAYWQFGNGNGEIEHIGNVVVHEFETIQNYEVALRVVSMDGCEATYSLMLDVQPSMTGIFVPTAFMPGSHDDRNRYLRVFATEQNPITSLRLSVFSMDGRELFTTNDPNRGWDGRYNGSEMPTGNYSWMVSARMSTGEEIVRSGVATLVR